MEMISGTFGFYKVLIILSCHRWYFIEHGKSGNSREMDWNGIQAHLRTVNGKNTLSVNSSTSNCESILRTIPKIQLNLLFIEEAVIIFGPGP